MLGKAGTDQSPLVVVIQMGWKRRRIATMPRIENPSESLVEARGHVHRKMEGLIISTLTTRNLPCKYWDRYQNLRRLTWRRWPAVPHSSLTDRSTNNKVGTDTTKRDKFLEPRSRTWCMPRTLWRGNIHAAGDLDCHHRRSCNA